MKGVGNHALPIQQASAPMGAASIAGSHAGSRWNWLAQANAPTALAATSAQSAQPEVPPAKPSTSGRRGATASAKP